jgi:hypothetical protein
VDLLPLEDSSRGCDGRSTGTTARESDHCKRLSDNYEMRTCIVKDTHYLHEGVLDSSAIIIQKDNNETCILYHCTLDSSYSWKENTDYISLYNNVPTHTFRSKEGNFIQVNIVRIVKSWRL